MRTTWALLAVVLVATPATASDGTFGAGEPTWRQYDAPEDLASADDAGEPTIGIPWNTDDVFYQAFATTYRIHFDDNAATWEDVTPANSVVNVDPMLHADPETGRVWSGGLAGPCSIMAFSDDNGETWTPTGNMCSGAQFDHQSIGSGPPAGLPAENPLFPHMTYYCAQLVFTACTFSVDGGLSWAPFTEVLPPCGGLHGHIRVSRVTGLAAVPDASCGNEAGFGYTDTDGAIWMSRTVTGSTVAPGGFDPSLDFGREEGWLWYGNSDADGAYIALSKDEGATWERIGGGLDATTWLDVGRLHDPAIVRASFADVRVGDDDRVAFAFLGVEDQDGDGDADEIAYPYQCDDDQGSLVWHYYIALSHDAGENWTVQKMTTDPVQVGGIWDGGGGEPCRNLLDFDDMDIDSRGRIHVAFADGCTRECAASAEPGSEGYRQDHAALLRQTGGKGLFSAYDVAPQPAGDEEPEEPAPAKDTPLPAWPLVAAPGAAWLRRRGG